MLKNKEKSFKILPSRSKCCCPFDTFSSSPHFPVNNFYCVDTSDFFIKCYSAFIPAPLETDSLIVYYITLA